MTHAQFLVAFNPVLEAFGAKNFPTIVLERIHAKVLDLSPKEMLDLCHLIIDNCERLPRTTKVIEFANLVRNRRRFSVKTEVIDEIPIRCTFCNDVGIHCVRYHHDDFETLVRCQCREGVTYDIALPQWEYRLEQIMKRYPCPISWFKPEVLSRHADGSIKIENIWNKVEYWRAKKSLAVGYWKQAAEEAKEIK